MSERRPRARRLTLAPRPAVEEAAEVVLPEQEHAALVADPLAGARRTFGSRFWPLADEVSSDEEEDAAGSSKLSNPRALTTGAVLQESEVWGLFSDAGKEGAQQSTTLDSRRNVGGPATKPWRGPLPAKRVSPRLTLGDVLATANKSTEGRMTPGRHEPDRELAAASQLAAADSIFENRHHRRVSGGGRGGVFLNGPRVTGPGRSIQLSNAGRTASFTGSAGLERLIARTGKLRTRVLGVQSKAASNVSSDRRNRTGDEMQGSGAGAAGRGPPRWEGDRAGRGRGRGPELGGFGGDRGRSHGYGGVTGEEEEFEGGGAFGEAPYGFDPGHGGYGPQGRGTHMRHGYRHRGSRGVGARRVGLAGRASRTSTPRGRPSSAPFTGRQGT